MTSRRTHHEPTLTLQLTGSLQPTCLQLTIQLSLSRAHRTPSSLQQLDAHPSYASYSVFSPEDHLFIEITMLHLYVKSNSSPLREVPISFSRTQLHHVASYGLHHQMAAPLRLPMYLAQGIKPTVVNLNKLHQAQALVPESSEANLSG